MPAESGCTAGTSSPKAVLTVGTLSDPRGLCPSSRHVQRPQKTDRLGSVATVRGVSGLQAEQLFQVIKFQNIPCHIQLHTYRELCGSGTAISGGRKATWSTTVALRGDRGQSHASIQGTPGRSW